METAQQSLPPDMAAQQPLPPPPPPIIAPEVADNEDETVQRLVQTEKSYRESPFRKAKEEEWRANYYAYRGYKVAGQNWCIREIWRQIESLIPKLTKVLLSGDQLFTMEARQDGFDEAAEGAAAVIHDQIKRFGSLEQLNLFIRDFCIYGTVYMLPGYRQFQRTHNAPKKTPMHARGEKDDWDRETSEVIEDAPFLEYLGPWEVYGHPLAEDIMRSPARFIVKYVSLGDMKTLAREGILDPVVLEEVAKNNSGGYHDNNDSVNGSPFRNKKPLDYDPDPIFKLSFCWTADGWHYIMVNDQRILHASIRNDVMIQASNYQQSREAWGTGEPTPIIDDQRLSNEVTDLLVLQQWYGLPMHLITAEERTNFLKAVRKPGGHIVVTNPANVSLLPQATSGGAPDLVNFLGFVIDRQKLTSGQSNIASGTSQGETKTATGIVKLSDNADERTQHKISTWLIPAFQKMYQEMYNLNAKHLNRIYSLRITGDDGLKQQKDYTPADFAPDVDVNIEIGGGAGPEQANTAMNMYKIYGQDPLVNRAEFIKEGVKAAGYSRPKRFMANPQNDQANALEESVLLSQTQIINDPKPTDDHMTHFQIHVNDPVFQGTPQGQNHLAIHQKYIMQMQAQQAQMAQSALMERGQGDGVNGGATQVQKGANRMANGMLGMAQRGAMQ